MPDPRPLDVRTAAIVTVVADLLHQRRHGFGINLCCPDAPASVTV
jgi:hypothetical protein